MKPIGEQIVAKEARIADCRDEMAELVKTAADESRELSTEELETIDSLSAEVEGAETSLKGLKQVEAALGKRAEARTKGVTTSASVPASVKAKEEAGTLLAKAGVVSLLAHVQRCAPDAIIQERYSHDPRVKAVHDFMAKSATEVATTTATGWAAELVSTDTVGFINELEAVSIYGAMVAGGTGIPFGTNSSISMPKRSGSGAVSGSFVQEGASIPVKADAYGLQTFNRYKAAVIVPFTAEIAQRSSPQIEGLIRNAIVSDTGDMLDSVLMNAGANAIAGVRPASPFFGAATQASAGDDQASILTDLKFLLGILSSANAGRSPAIVMNPARATALTLLTNSNGAFVFRDEIAQGRLLNVPLVISTNCPADQVYIIDLADFASAFDAPNFVASEQVTLVMADDDGTDPTMEFENAVSTTGSLNVSDAAGTTPPTVVKSMFQTNSIALRMIMPVTWGMMRSNTAGYLSAVSW